jgi:hypothetical protein
VKRIALLAFVLLNVGVVSKSELNVRAISFVTLSGRALSSDGQPIVNAKVRSDETNGINRVLTCTKADGSWSLEVPVNSAERTVYIWLSPKLTGNSNIDCDAPTSGSIPSLGCWTEVGPFVATSDRTVNFNVSAMQTRTLRIVDGDGFPLYGAAIGGGSGNNGQSGVCPVSSPQIVTSRSVMDDGGDGDTDMDGLITVVGATPFGKNISIYTPGGSSIVEVNLSSTDQRVELPVRQSLPGAPTVTVRDDKGRPRISITANSKDIGISKFTVKLRDESPVCTIVLQSNAKDGSCYMADWLRGETYDFVATTWNGKGEGTGASSKYTTPGWNTTSTSAPVSSTTQNATPTTIVSTPTVTLPTTNTSMTNSDTAYTSTKPPIKVKISKAIAVKSIATFVELAVMSTSKVSLKVLSGSTKYCKVSGTSLKGLKAGSCKVTVTVTPKKGKAISKTVSLKVTK